MKQTEGTGYYLEPGYIYFSKRATTVRSVLGSCVAVCLWDKTQKFGGMNHFVRPKTDDAQKATPHYGNVATAALVRIMEDSGSRRSDLTAQILGGGVPEGGKRPAVGDENVRVARELLNRKGIKIISEDTGGNMGRKIAFNTGTGELAVLKTSRIRETDWAR